MVVFMCFKCGVETVHVVSGNYAVCEVCGKDVHLMSTTPLSSTKVIL